MEAVRAFISTIADHPEAQLPAWLTAAVTQLVFDFSIGAWGSGAGGWEENRTAAVNLGDEAGPGVGRMVSIDDGRVVINLNPAERLDIDEMMKIPGTLNSTSSPAVVIARCAAIVRMCARVLALKHGSPEEALTLKDAIIGCTSLANQLHGIAGGEVDLAAVDVKTSAPANETPRPRRKREWTPEQRAAAAERMQRVSKAMHERRRQEAAGGNPSLDGDFPAGDDVAEGVGSAAGGAVGSVV